MALGEAVGGNDVIGASLSGVHEAIWTLVAGVLSRPAQLHSVIAPRRQGAPILAGEACARSRVALGLPWPPEARVASGREMRRVPVPVLWRGLTLRRDGRSVWTTNSLSTRFSDLLAAHVVSALGNASDDHQLVLTIPDALSNFSQQELLDALARLGRRTVRLLWNPVALSLAWLESLGASLKLSSDEDSILVLHLGAGAIDCTTLRLREVMDGGTRYIVPVRRGGRVRSESDGFDLAVNRLDRAVARENPPLNLQSRWCALGFPGVWQPESPSRSEDRFLWYSGSKWQAFPRYLLEHTLTPDLFTAPSTEIENLLHAHGAPPRTYAQPATWNHLIRQIVQTALSETSGTLRGIIISGLPFGRACSSWSQLFVDAGSALKTWDVNDRPRPDAIWNAGMGDSAIAEGAGVFTKRLLRGLTTYFDVLPKLDVLASKSGKRSWERLVHKDEVVGGETHHDLIKGEFALERGRKDFEAILQLHDDDATSIRSTIFHFPRAPERLMPLDLRVEVRPAGGLTVLEMIPEDRGFLGGVQVYLDYEDMTELTSLPEEELAFPEIIIPHKVDPQDCLISFRNTKDAIDTFLAYGFAIEDYDWRLKKLKSSVTSAILRDDPHSGKMQYRIVGLDGGASTPKGREIIAKLGARLGQDFMQASRSHRPTERVLTNKIVTAGSWLFGAVPEPIREFVVRALHAGGPHAKANVVNAAGRILNKPGEFRSFFSTMASSGIDRQSEVRRFKINWLWAAKRILSGHESSAESLERKTVVQIYRCLLHDFQSWIEERRANGFVATLWLLLYFLRYRIVDATFLAPESERDQDLRQALGAAVDQAKAHLGSRQSFLAGSRQRTALEILDGLIKFRDLKGSMGILIKLVDLGEEDQE